MKKIITIVLLVFVGFSTQAQVKKNKNAKYVTEVNGNCEQCQKRIQKRRKMQSFGCEKSDC